MRLEPHFFGPGSWFVSLPEMDGTQIHVEGRKASGQGQLEPIDKIIAFLPQTPVVDRFPTTTG
jgi:hypothetical protein